MVGGVYILPSHLARYMYLLSFLIVMQAGPSRANANCDLNRNAENLTLGLSVEQSIFFAR